jgi:hypothetical protein
VQDFPYFVVRSWHNELKRWLDKTTVKQLREASTKPRSTLKILARATSSESERVPTYPLTRAPNRGQNQIRMRLLCGTSALNETLSRFRSDRDSACPYAECEGEKETAEHFLLHCKATEDLRQEYFQNLGSRCECERRIGAGGVPGCDEFFAGLDDTGKALFMLGGPVDDRQPELQTDGAAKEFVAQAYERRKQKLDAEAQEPMVEDLTGGERATQVRGGIRRFLSADAPPPRAHVPFPPVRRPKPADIRVLFAAARARPRPSSPPIQAVNEEATEVTPHASQRLALACHNVARTHEARSGLVITSSMPQPEMDSITDKLRDAI